MNNNQADNHLKILYQDNDLLAIDKPAGLVVYNSKKEKRESLMSLIVKKFPKLKEVGQAPRYGLIHRLDKETSGIILIAKNNQALKFLQEEFKNREIEKKYLALVYGQIKEDKGNIKTLIGRAKKDRKKQQVYLPFSPEGQKKGLRKAETYWKVKKRFKGYTLVEAVPKTGRKHQVRVHLAYINHPIVGDKIYAFKNQTNELKKINLKRQFLHCSYLKFKSLSNEEKEVKSDLPLDLKRIIKNI